MSIRPRPPLGSTPYSRIDKVVPGAGADDPTLEVQFRQPKADHCDFD